MKSFLFFVFLFCFSFLFSLFVTESCFAQSGPWQRINLTSTSGVQIRLDYQMNSQCIRFTKEGRRDYQARMAVVWAAIYGVSPNNRVEIEIQSYKQDMIPHGSGQNPILRTYEHYDRTIPFPSLGPGRYTANLGLIATRVTSSSARIEDRIFQRLQVRINGVPLIDPISRTDAFTISMYDRVPCL